MGEDQQKPELGSPGAEEPAPTTPAPDGTLSIPGRYEIKMRPGLAAKATPADIADRASQPPDDRG
jgi:hypothetical protein